MVPDFEKNLINIAGKAVLNNFEFSKFLNDIRQYDLTGETQVALVKIANQCFFSFKNYKKELYEYIFSREYLAKCNPNWLNNMVENLVCQNEFVSKERINDYLNYYIENSPYSGNLLVKNGRIKRMFFNNLIDAYLGSKLEGTLEIADEKIYFAKKSQKTTVIINGKKFTDIKIKILKKYLHTFDQDLLKKTLLCIPQILKYKNYYVARKVIDIFKEPSFLKNFLTKNYEYFANKKNLSSFKNCYYNSVSGIIKSEEVDKIMEEIGKNIKLPKIWLKY